MNLASSAGDPGRIMLFAGYNQDSSSIAVGTKDGYQLFLLSAIDRLDRIYNNDIEKETCIVGRLFSSSLIAIVSLNAPRKLKVCHFKKGTEICSYSYTNSILAVKLNRQRLVVCLEESLYIHNIRDMKVVHTIKETAANPAGICDLSHGGDTSLLAYPGSSQSGHIEIFDTLTLRSVASILAHDNPIASLAFNSSADKIATASEKGTVIRVFSVPSGEKLFEFRRGLKRSVHITSLSFSGDNQYLCSSSNTETIHIFKLDAKADKSITPTQDESSSSWAGYVSSYLPSGVSNVFNQFRAFATCHLTVAGLRTVSTIANIHRVPTVVVISEDGLLQIFGLDPSEGGECKLLRSHRVDHIADQSNNEPNNQGDRPLTDGTQSHLASGTASYSKKTIPPLNTTDSRSYQDLPSGASPPQQAVDEIRLDDPAEFPPVSTSPP